MSFLYNIRCCFFRGWILASGGLLLILQHRKTTVYISQLQLFTCFKNHNNIAFKKKKLSYIICLFV